MATDEKPIDSASKSNVRERKRSAATIERAQVDAWRNVLSSEDGRRVLWQILEFVGLYRQGYKSGDAAQYRDGMQNVGAFIVATSEKAQPDALWLMKQQQTKDNPHGN